MALLSEFVFYKAKGELDKLVFPLLEKSIAINWRVLVKCNDAEVVEDLWGKLWFQPGNKFIPIGKLGDSFESDHPVLLSEEMSELNQANSLILYEGTSYANYDLSNYHRVMVVFNQEDSTQLKQSRELWKQFSTFKKPMVLFDRKNTKWEVASKLHQPT